MVLIGHTLVLDTAGATSAIAKELVIQSIYWDAPTTAGHTVVLHDAASGAVVFQDTAPGANLGRAVSFPGGKRVKGLYLTTLASGVLVVNVARSHA
jgi:hypothetical protein